ncbi:MAG: NYN domain-containing protein [Clostridia bacterium]|nr:NYN domain-containing protein [Clostridia bacterium]MDE7329225.1 NYN domain-containing protein [Clostridia bacterium]
MNYAVLVDLNSMRLSYDSFAKALTQIDGKVAYAKLYGYNNKRNNDFNNFIKTYGAEVALPVNNRKKVRIDIRQVIDAMIIACTHKSVDAFFIICSELDSIAMINALKKLGKKVVMGIQSPSFVAEQCDGFVTLERLVAADGGEEKSVSNNNLEVEDEREFLPYSGIESKKIDEMKVIKEELAKLIEAKKRQKSEIEIGQNVLQLDDLLKQYF